MQSRSRWSSLAHSSSYNFLALGRRTLTSHLSDTLLADRLSDQARRRVARLLGEIDDQRGSFFLFAGGGLAQEDGEGLNELYSDRVPLGRVGRPDDIASAVSFLASDDSSYVAGSELFVDGGLAQV